MKQRTSKVVSEIKERMWQIFRDKGYTQTELALKMGSKQQTINKVFNHSPDIKITTMEKFAEATNTPITELWPY